MAKVKNKFDNKHELDPSKIAELGSKKRFHPHDLISLTPQNPRQEAFLIDYYQQTPMILQYGAAGTGKTTMALYAALSDVFDSSSPYDRVLIVRSAVASRDVGFLPGDLNDKSAPYEEPYRNISNEIIKYNQPYDNLKSLGYLEFRLSSNLRGCTFDNTIILIDEVQNFEKEELLTVLTRAGYNSRILLCGDSKQDDLRGKKGQQSCFQYLLELMDNMDVDYQSSIHYHIDDCLRNPLVKEILRADASM